MKHVKEIQLFETRIYKDHKKYVELVKNKFKADKAMVYTEYGTTIIVLDFAGSVENDIFMSIYNNLNVCKFRITTTSDKFRQHIRYEISNVPHIFFEKLELEANANKYNL